jgi:hypothetical protein
MKKKLLFIALLTPAIAVSAANSSDIVCLAAIMYSEARGESVEGAIAIGQASVNRSKRMGVSICKLPGVTAKNPPGDLKQHYLALAKSSLNSKLSLSVVKTADSWNTGVRPHSTGKITRHIGRHTFYVMADL